MMMINYKSESYSLMAAHLLYILQTIFELVHPLGCWMFLVHRYMTVIIDVQTACDKQAHLTLGCPELKVMESEQIYKL